MKNIQYLLIAASISMIGCQGQKDNTTHEHGEEPKADAAVDTVKKSIPMEEHAQIDGTHIMIKYHAPAVRGRTIWGGLVPYDEVWVTGAHSATSLEIDKEVTISSTKVVAGKYALFTIPGKEKWTIIINKNWDQHLADEYDSKDDVIRVEVTPEVLSENQERLKYSISSESKSRASISVSWEKLKVTLPVQLN